MSLKYNLKRKDKELCVDMTARILTPHDLNILEKIKDPEAISSHPVLLDSSLPRDPHVSDPDYSVVVQQESECIKSMMGQAPPSSSSLKELDRIIDRFPSYASARNNRVQALRMLYGDNILVTDNNLDSDASESMISRAESILQDLSTVISLLSPSSPFKAINPTSAKTLSSAYTQRGALYLAAANLISSASKAEKKVCLSPKHPEASWGEIEFREAASRDFTMGGRYGNSIAKGLAVAINPTAKLCGEMVREAMKKEYGQ